MTDLSELSNDELNERLALLCGWTKAEYVQATVWATPEGIRRTINFTDSIDAQQVPDGPEELARNKGYTAWEVLHYIDGGNAMTEAILWADINSVMAHTPLEPRSRAECLVQVLETGDVP